MSCFNEAAATDHRFSDAEIAAVYKAIALRRDMRHFGPGQVPEPQLTRLLAAAHRAPSVGFMQPWRFVRITDPVLRRAIHALVEAERIRTAQALGEREDEFMRLKVEGVLDCAELLVAALMDGRARHIFGRRTLPEMDLASVACAIQNLWLAARAEGLGLGWVSPVSYTHLDVYKRQPVAPAISSENPARPARSRQCRDPCGYRDWYKRQTRAHPKP